jgi:hypothetical protein
MRGIESSRLSRTTEENFSVNVVTNSVVEAR